MAGFPLWLRKLPSHELCVPVGPLPIGAVALAHIAHHVPTRKRDTSRWLRDVSTAAQWDTPEFAVWVAPQPASLLADCAAPIMTAGGTTRRL